MQNLIERLGLGEGAAPMAVWIGLSVLMLVVVLALAIWLIRTLRPSLNLGGSAGRSGRPQRLAITDAFTLDREGRKLVVVRRDNVEHLLLIGGPNDLLIEPNIVRNERGARERGRLGADADLLHAAEAALSAELPRSDGPDLHPPMSLPPAPPAPVAPPPRPPIAAAPISKPQAAPRLDDEFEKALAAMQQAQRQQPAPQPVAPVAPPPPPPIMARPMPAPPPPPPPPAPPLPPKAAPPPPPPAPAPPKPVAPPPPAPPAPPAAPPMSDMARRLNEVLQKPMSGTLRQPFNKPIPPVPPVSVNPLPPAPPKPASAPPAPPAAAPAPPAPQPPPAPKAEAASPPPEPAAAPVVPAATPAKPAPGSDAKGSAKAAPAKPADSEMDLLEEEMARLLGRPPQPPGPGST
jgi:flagellar protein FliO/FliZ